MGVDLFGFIEVASPGPWEAIFDLKRVERNYQLMGLLFGIRGSGVLPIGKGRGVPEFPSAELRKEIDDFGIEPPGLTWVLWSEVPEELCGGLITLYEIELHRKIEGGLVLDGTTLLPAHLSLDETYSVYGGREIDRGRYVYRSKARNSRVDIPPEWASAFRVCSEEAARRGSGNVRLVGYPL